MSKPSKLDRCNQGDEFRAEARRRELHERYPDLSRRMWSNVGNGLAGVGLQALRQWLRSVQTLTGNK